MRNGGSRKETSPRGIWGSSKDRSIHSQGLWPSVLVGGEGSLCFKKGRWWPWEEWQGDRWGTEVVSIGSQWRKLWEVAGGGAQREWRQEADWVRASRECFRLKSIILHRRHQQKAWRCEGEFTEDGRDWGRSCKWEKAAEDPIQAWHGALRTLSRSTTWDLGELSSYLTGGPILASASMTFPKGASYDTCTGGFRLLADSQMRVEKGDSWQATLLKMW